MSNAHSVLIAVRDRKRQSRVLPSSNLQNERAAQCR